MLQKMNLRDFDKMYALMKSSFPPDEYRPKAEQRTLFDDPRYCVYVMPDTKKNDIKAFIAVHNFNSFSYIEHFAVNPAYRCGGLGTQILHEISAILPNPICLEAELPNSDIARRRIGFYERNGFFVNDYEYIQPPISKGKNPIPLIIMTSVNGLTHEQLNDIKETLYKFVYHVF